jgi:hypothetical protein
MQNFFFVYLGISDEICSSVGLLWHLWHDGSSTVSLPLELRVETKTPFFIFAKSENK